MSSFQKTIVWTTAAVVFHVLIVIATTSETFFYFNVGTSQPLFGGSINAMAIFDDVHIYYKYATLALEGKIPYRDYVMEYPILAFPLFVLPRVFAHDFETYKIAFGVEMLLADAVLVYLVARRVGAREGLARVPARLAWYTVCVLAFGSLTVARFDFAATLLGFAGALWWFSGRNALGGLAAGLGTLMKVFPGVVAAPALVWEARRWRTSRMRGTLVFAATVALGASVWLALGGRRVAESLGYHLGRGLEIGSVYSGVLMAAGRLGGWEMRAEYVRSAEELTAPGSALVTRLAVVAQGLALLLVMIRARKANDQNDGLRYAAAAVLALIVTGKVLSPQYLVWLLPFVAVLEGPSARLARWLFLAACLATTAAYPWSYMGLVNGFHPLSLAILNLRNALLVILLGWLIFGVKDGLTFDPGSKGVIR